jgi:hypothetical protein
MHAPLGFGSENTILRQLCVVIMPVPIALYKYGELIRKKLPVYLQGYG